MDEIQNNLTEIIFTENGGENGERSIFGNILDYYNQIMEKKDDRVNDWFLMSSPIPTISVVTLYLYVIIQGQKIMKNRQPFELKAALITYNFFLVLLSFYMLVEFICSSWTAPGFNLLCQPVDYSNDPNALRLASACWWFYFSKIIELMDTVFFMLRKKNKQITFLHVYHHTTMPLLWWVGTKFVAGGDSYFSASINSGVHVLMYLYYMLSAMGPEMQQYLWWKKYMTSLQLIQFWLVIFKSSCAVYLNCGFPLGYEYLLISYVTSHIILFSHFFYNTYCKQQPQHPPPSASKKAEPEPEKELVKSEDDAGCHHDGPSGELRQRNTNEQLPDIEA